ncbi:MAG: hypothetical protein MUO38_12500 [Anaerolineales bacterium]|nr:hypothetical protein [Anaerolineales bacterium]
MNLGGAAKGTLGMDRQQLTDHVVQRLGELAGRNDIVREVCEKGQLHWADAEALVDEVLASQSQTIARRRYPIFLAISVVTLAAGFLLVVSTAVWLFEFLRPVMEEGGPLSLTMVFFVLSANGPLLEQALIGAAMMIGASVGLYWAAAST